VGVLDRTAGVRPAMQRHRNHHRRCAWAPVAPLVSLFGPSGEEERVRGVRGERFPTVALTAIVRILRISRPGLSVPKASSPASGCEPPDQAQCSGRAERLSGRAVRELRGNYQCRPRLSPTIVGIGLPQVRARSRLLASSDDGCTLGADSNPVGDARQDVTKHHPLWRWRSRDDTPGAT